jgi:hypothetical protein
MNTLVRMLCSGMIGLLIVLSLFLLMQSLLGHHGSDDLAQPTAEPVTIHVPLATNIARPVINVEKPKRILPKQKQVPGIELTDVRMYQTGGAELAQSLSAGAQATVSDLSSGTGSQGNGMSENKLDTTGMYKYYEHNLRYPNSARNAGITTGELLARAVFDQNHRFLRFEILAESTPEQFRSVLFQLKFVHNHNHLHHPLYNVDKGPVKPALGEHSDTYRFVFDLDSKEPVRMYVGHPSEQAY